MSQPSEHGATAASSVPAAVPGQHVHSSLTKLTSGIAATGARGEMGEALLEVRGLQKHFPLTQGIVFKRTVGHVRAVDGVDLTLRRGETVGLVGESGCGKSTVSKLIVALEKPTAGSILFKGRDVAHMGGRALKDYRREVQIIFQDPYASLNPRMTVGDIVAEGWSVHADVAPKKGRLKRTQELLDRVGLNPDYVNRYPHQFSGGQRQRIGIARALALQPEVIVCDEPVSALDVSVQAQVVNLLEDLQDELGLSYLFIAHDLSVVRHISDRVAVMYLGSIVEEGTADEVYSSPSHPYTQALLSSVPLHEPHLRGQKDRILLQGDVPSPADPPSGCRFRTRCWKAQDVCATDPPQLVDRGQGHPSACHFAEARTVVPVDAE
ncbi:ABC transporter ATP-binding protein [Geodermatophilus amargosae]|uniref:ABC transporter ATP-binding protein n=1 Tax=Geodermatophilus amargosae TaxID=1296565 RepID=UPI003F7F9D9B